MINLRHIEVFHAVMRTGSITAAARELNVTQPAVSAVIKHLEARLGMPLFERTQGRLFATAEAEALVPDVSEIFARLEAVERLSQDLAGGSRGRLSIAAASPIAHGVLAKAVASFVKLRPEVRVSLQSLSSPLVIERVLNREVELGIAYEPVVSPALYTEVLMQSSIACILPADHPLASLRAISIADLKPYPIVTYLPQAILRPYVDKALSESGISLSLSVETGLSVTAIMLAYHGAGIALVEPNILDVLPLAGLTSRPLTPSVEFRSLLIRRHMAPSSRLMEQFIDHLRQLAKAHESIS
jgi:molybdate transport repressor ModE-like protein